MLSFLALLYTGLITRPGIHLPRRKKKSNLIEIALSKELDEARLSCAGKNWWGRALLLGYMAYVGFESAVDPMFQSLFKGFDLGVHELGHYLFAPLGEFMHVAGGSLFQCMLPFIAMVMFRQQRDFFGISFAFGWLGINLFDVATYADDARTQQLQLVSPGAQGDEIIHDWNWLLNETHLLPYDHGVAQLMRFAAVLCMMACLSMGSWLCWEMYRQRSQKPSKTLPLDQ